MRIATWNVNSIRSRIDRVLAFLERHEVDVLALQETKCREDQFPALELSSMGYEFAHFGMNQWNGVAIASRVGLEDVATQFADDQPQFGEVLEPRAIGATCGSVRMWSLYVPNGRELDHEHYVYKLQWLERLRAAGEAWLVDDPTAQVALTGDWNIAPQDDDVWDIDVFAGKTHVSPAERAAFNAIVESGYADVVRPHTPGPGVYTYWDYQQLSFPKRKGMRIDFILGSPALAARVTGAFIDREERKGKGASDHAPVVVDLAD
ncbi:exodeoxyribonuclease III [Aeromicrobium phragmitis]|uniref:Exodeoxyribonuclease III n=1 Tax=Aeromicrobium phragmitis TaxID=2478914 RepID=A0A3L8PJW8_9ACTN|nr:exodeoxyribonuclease III [Aeromicrobium phragmitis]RLV55003.1 exodeoxyribonuclease III [Aeromicrobium phragmitis]